MYNDAAYSEWRTYVEEQCPDVTFNWENNRDSTQNLIYQVKHGDMADVVTIRRFESDSAAELAPFLMDLSGEELTSTFTEGTLAPFTFKNKLCWYPAPGMMEVLYANESLFECCGIKLPETIDELESACRQFRELGIDGLSIDASTGYRAAFLIEGFNYAGCFAGGDGGRWMSSMLAGKEARLSNSYGAQIASVLRAFAENSLLEQRDLTLDAADTWCAFDSEQAVMVVVGSDLTVTGKMGTKYQIIPCLGKSVSDRILYTYPVFNTAVSKEVENNSAKKAVVERVLRVMYSSEAQKILAHGTDALLSYNSGINLPVNGPYTSVADLIQQKKCFIRCLNHNAFSAFSSSVKQMTVASASDEQFTDDLNTALNRPLNTAVIGKSDIEAGNQQGESNPLERVAASVLAQTVRDATGADVVVMEGKAAAAPIYRGDYTENDLSAVVADENLFEAQLTGAQLQDIFDDAIVATTTYRYQMIEPLVDYPALSGAKAFLSADGSVSRLMLPDGSSLQPDQVYHVVISGTIQSALVYLQNAEASSFTRLDATLQSVFRGQLVSGSLPKPEQYFEVEAAQ